MKYKNIAVIGAGGFIGKNLSARLGQIQDIRLKLFTRKEIEKFSQPVYAPNQEDKNKIQNDFKQTELLYYLASSTIPATSWKDPFLEIEQNLVPFLRIMEGASESNIKKVVFVSSAGTVYGTSSEKLNEDAYKKPYSPYGITKLTMEYFLEYYFKRNGIVYDIFRVSNVYGPGQDTKKGLGIINTFLEKIISGEELQVFGNGESLRNYIYIDDVSDILLRSLNNNEDKCSVFNLSSNDTLSINDLIQIIKTTVDMMPPVRYIDNRLSDNPSIMPDNKKLLSAFPDVRFTPIELGIKKTYQHLKSVIHSNNTN